MKWRDVTNQEPADATNLGVKAILTLEMENWNQN